MRKTWEEIKAERRKARTTTFLVDEDKSVLVKGNAVSTLRDWYDIKRERQEKPGSVEAYRELKNDVKTQGLDVYENSKLREMIAASSKKVDDKAKATEDYKTSRANERGAMEIERIKRNNMIKNDLAIRNSDVNKPTIEMPYDRTKKSVDKPITIPNVYKKATEDYISRNPNAVLSKTMPGIENGRSYLSFEQLQKEYDTRLKPKSSNFMQNKGDNEATITKPNQQQLGQSRRREFGQNVKLGLVSFSNALMGADSISRLTDSAIRNSLVKQGGDVEAFDRNVAMYSEDKMLNDLMGRSTNAEFSNTDRAIQGVGEVAGDIGQLIALSIMSGGIASSLKMGPKVTAVVRNALTGALSGAEYAYGEGGDAETVLTDALLSAGFFTAGSLASQRVGVELIKKLTPIYEKYPQWGTALRSIQAAGQGATFGAVGTATQIGIGKILGKETPTFNDVIKSGLVLAGYDVIMSILTKQPFITLEKQGTLKSKNFTQFDDSLTAKNLQKRGYVEFRKGSGIWQNPNDPSDVLREMILVDGITVYKSDIWTAERSLGRTLTKAEIKKAALDPTYFDTLRSTASNGETKAQPKSAQNDPVLRVDTKVEQSQGTGAKIVKGKEQTAKITEQPKVGESEFLTNSRTGQSLKEANEKLVTGSKVNTKNGELEIIDNDGTVATVKNNKGNEYKIGVVALDKMVKEASEVANVAKPQVKQEELPKKQTLSESYDERFKVNQGNTIVHNELIRMLDEDINKFKEKNPKATQQIESLEKVRSKYNVIEDAESETKAEKKIYRATGKTVGKEYTTFAYPILGEADYYATTPDNALQYGDKLEEKTADLKNPLVIQDDDAWREITEAAGWEVPSFDPYDTKVNGKKLVEQLKEAILSKGYDGVVIDYENNTSKDLVNQKTGHNVFLLDRLFGHDQVVDYTKSLKTNKESKANKEAKKEVLGIVENKKIKLYHGSYSANIDKLKPSTAQAGLGIFLTDKQELTKNYGENAYEVEITPKKIATDSDYLDAKHELESDLQKILDAIQEEMDPDVMSDNQMRTLEHEEKEIQKQLADFEDMAEGGANAKISKLLKEKGFDVLVSEMQSGDEGVEVLVLDESIISSTKSLTKEVKKEAKPVETKKEGKAIYRATGKTEGKEYVQFKYPILGGAMYYTTSPQKAKKYGDHIEKSTLSLKNPLIINDDVAWRKMTTEAGWVYPMPSMSASTEEVKVMAEKLKAVILKKGYDGVIIEFEDFEEGDINYQTGNPIKTLRNVFGEDQVVDYTQKPQQDTKPVTEKKEKVDTAPKPQKKTTKTAAEKDTTKTQDFGEKIGGARKDQWRVVGLDFNDLENMNDREIEQHLKKDSVWGKLDYMAMVDEGIPREVVYAIKKIKDAIPVKPYYAKKNPEMTKAIQKQFIDTIKEIKQVLSTVKTRADAKKVVDNYLLKEGYLTVSQGGYGGYNATEKTTGNLVMRSVINELVITDRKLDQYVRDANKKQFAMKPDSSSLPKGYDIRFNDASKEGKFGDWKPNTYYVTKGNYIEKTNFDTKEDAEKWINEIVNKTKEGGKKRFIPPQLKNLKRDGPDYRDDLDVKGQDYLDVFGFKGGEFGNWLNENDRKQSLNYGYDALMDLANILGIEPSDISLDKTLSVAFGARGVGGASAAVAHYEPARRVINLTKMKGAGSLAHEWFHALDDFLGTKDGTNDLVTKKGSSKLFASIEKLVKTMKFRDMTEEEAKISGEKWVAGRVKRAKYSLDIATRGIEDKLDAKGKIKLEALKERYLKGDETAVDEISELRKEAVGRIIPKQERDDLLSLASMIRAAIENNKKTEIRQTTSKYYDGSKLMGEHSHKDGDYWDSNIEMAARAFACYINDKLEGKRSDYLNGHSESYVMPYIDAKGEMQFATAVPQGEERIAINKAFDELFEEIKKKGVLTSKTRTVKEKSKIEKDLDATGIAEKDGLTLKIVMSDGVTYDVQGLVKSDGIGSYREFVARELETREDAVKEIKSIFDSAEKIEKTKEAIRPKREEVVEAKVEQESIEAEVEQDTIQDLIDDPYANVPEEKAEAYRNLYTADAYEKKSLVPTKLVPKKRSVNLINETYGGNGHWVVEKRFIKKAVQDQLDKSESKPIETSAINSFLDIQTHTRDREIVFELIGFNDVYVALRDPESDVVIAIDKNYYDYFRNQGLTFKQFREVKVTNVVGLYEGDKIVGVVLPVRAAVSGEKASDIVNLKNNYPPKAENVKNTNEPNLTGFKVKEFEIKTDKGNQTIKGLTIGDYGFNSKNNTITHIPTGAFMSGANNQNHAKLIMKYYDAYMGEVVDKKLNDAQIEVFEKAKDFSYREIDELLEGKGHVITADEVKAFIEKTHNETTTKSDDMLEFMQGSTPKSQRPLGIIAGTVKPVSMTEKFKFDDDLEVEHEKNRIKPISFRLKIINMATNFKNISTRTFREIDENNSFLAEARKELINYKAFKTQAGFYAGKILETITSKEYHKLSREEFNRFERFVLLRDLMEDLESGRELPYPYTAEKLPMMYETLKASLNENIEEAIARRDAALEKVKNDYIKAMKSIGFNKEDSFTKKNYFRHQVLEYYNAEQELRGSGSRVRGNTNRGFTKHRDGTVKPINEDYLQAEFETLWTMIYDTKVAEMLNNIRKGYDITAKLKAQAKDSNHKLFDSMIENEVSVLKAFGIKFEKKNYFKLKKLYGISSPLMEMETKFRQLIAMNFSELSNFADNGLLPNPNGRYTKAIDALMSGGMKEDDSRVMEYLSFLADQEDGSVGKINALGIFSAIDKKEKLYKETLKDKYYEWRHKVDARLIPPEYDTFQPIEGKRMMFVNTVTEELAEALLEAATDNFDLIHDLRKSKMKVSQMLAMGGDKMTYILPAEVSYTLQNVYENLGSDKGWKKYISKSQGLWKKWILQINPFKIIKYNLRNATGDLDAILPTAGTGTLKFTTRATKEAWEAIHYGRFTKEFLEFYERGGLQSNFYFQEIADINKHKIFDRFKHKTTLDALKFIPKTYIEFVGDLGQARETVLRYAAYLYYKEAIKKNGGKVDYYGASKKPIIDGLKSVEDKAFQLSNDALGAYDQISELGQALRKYVIPFWSWTEVNFKRYKRIAVNAHEYAKINEILGKKMAASLRIELAGKAVLKLGSIYLRVMLLTAALYAWNRLVKKDDDDKLPESVQNVPHLTLYTDEETGNVVYYSRLGALTDLLEWFGLDTLPQDIEELGLERKTWKEQISDNTTASLNKIINSLSPFLKAPIELLGKQTYFPDFREPRHIRDGMYYIAQTLGLEQVYTKVMDLPMNPIKANIVMDAFVYVADPEQIAYYRIIDLKRKFEKNELNKAQTTVFSDDPKSEKLYYMKLAMKYGDMEKTQRYLLEYLELGGTERGLERSITSMNPLYGLDDVEAEQFMMWLSPRERADLLTAVEFYIDALSLGEETTE